MYYTVTTVMSVFAGVILTIVRCRMAQTRHKRARWSFAFMGASLAGVVMVALIDRRTLFHVGEFNNQIPVWGAAFLDFIYSGTIALGLASLVVYRYRNAES